MTFSKFQSIILISIITGLILGVFANPVYAEKNKKIRAIRKVLIVSEEQLQEGIEMSKTMGIGEVAQGIPPALENKITENMLPYVHEEIVYEEETQLSNDILEAVAELAAGIVEYFPVIDGNIEAGDLVSILDKEELLLNTETRYLIEKSTQPYESRLLGVISSNASMKIDDSKDDSGQILRPVALIGKSPVKVSLENGPIAVGDYLTSSALPGIAMRAGRTGKVIGMALEPFNDIGVGKIMVSLNIGWYNNGLFAEDTATSTNIDFAAEDGFFNKLKAIASIMVDTVTDLPKLVVNGILEVRDDVVSGGMFKSIIRVARTVLEGRTLAINNATTTENTNLEIESEDEQNVSFVVYSILSPRKEIMVSGSGKLVMGEGDEVEAKIVFHPSFSSLISENVPVRVVVTPTSYINGQLYTAEKSISGFTIKEINAQDVGAEFDWIVTARLTDADLAEEILAETDGIAVQESSTTTPASVPATCENGSNRACGTEVGACQVGVQICEQGVWGECIGSIEPTTEICDGVDNDCDGEIDEESICTEPEPAQQTASTEPIVEPETSTSTIPVITTTTTEPFIETSTTTSSSTESG